MRIGTHQVVKGKGHGVDGYETALRHCMKESETRHEGRVGGIELHRALRIHLHAVVLTLLESIVSLGIEFRGFLLLRLHLLEILGIVDELGIARRGVFVEDLTFVVQRLFLMVEVFVHLIEGIPGRKFLLVARIAGVEFLVRLDGTRQVVEAVHVEETEMIEAIGDE